LYKIIIPLSAYSISIDDYVQYLLSFRKGVLDISNWPDCTPEANDKRMAREFLLFLSNYGYLKCIKASSRFIDEYHINDEILSEIQEIIELPDEVNQIDALNEIRETNIVQDIERKRIITYRIERPNQNRFRRSVLKAYHERCLLTGINMTEVLEAAHIKPVEYNGGDSVGNGLCLRLDLHQLFDTGHLRIGIDGTILLSNKAYIQYSAIIPNRINIPNFVDQNCLRWRWDNYNGI